MRLVRYGVLMAAFLAYESALAYLRSHAAHGGKRLPYARVTKLPASAKETSSAVSGCPAEAFIHGKAHVLVSSHAARSLKPSCVCHIWSTQLASGSFYSIGDDIFVSTPEFLFLQMANTVSRHRLIAIGYELCGTHVIYRQFGRGIATSTHPLTSTSRIARFLEKSPGRYGVKTAREALRWVVDMSNSPMESTLSMLFVLPRMQGGQPLSGIELNREFPLNDEWRRRLGKRSFKPDIYFTKERVAVEYYGSDHEKPDAKEYDATRQALMEYLGIRVLGVTKEQLYHPDKYQGMLKELYRLLGKRYIKPTPKQQMATLFLKDEILPNHDSSRYLGAFWR